MTVSRNIHPLPYKEEYFDGFVEYFGKAELRVGGGVSDELISLWTELLSNFTAGTVQLIAVRDASLPEFCAATGTAAPVIPDKEYSYRVRVNGEGAALESKDLEGLRYAFYTFLQLLQRRGDNSITGYAAPFC